MQHPHITHTSFQRALAITKAEFERKEILNYDVSEDNRGIRFIDVLTDQGWNIAYDESLYEDDDYDADSRPFAYL